jgi:hypothetical protein
MGDLPPAWRIGPTSGDAPCEARRLSPFDDPHPFGGLAIQGTREQVLRAARLIEYGGACEPVTPLRRRPQRERLTADSETAIAYEELRVTDARELD